MTTTPIKDFLTNGENFILVLTWFMIIGAGSAMGTLGLYFAWYIIRHFNGNLL